jgi:sialic acid synthase SpsE
MIDIRATQRTGVPIGPRKIGLNDPCFFLPEAGVTHNGSLDMAFRLVDAAFRTEANGVKFQTFVSKQVISATAPKAAQRETTGTAESPLELLKKLEFPLHVFKEIQGYCKSVGVLFLSTPFEESSVEPGEFAAMVGGFGIIEGALEDRCKRTLPDEHDTVAVGGKCLVSAREFARGRVLTEHEIAIRRQGNGLAPALLSQLIGRRLSRDVPDGELLQGEMFS